MLAPQKMAIFSIGNVKYIPPRCPLLENCIGNAKSSPFRSYVFKLDNKE